MKPKSCHCRQTVSAQRRPGLWQTAENLWKLYIFHGLPVYYGIFYNYPADEAARFALDNARTDASRIDASKKLRPIHREIALALWKTPEDHCLFLLGVSAQLRLSGVADASCAALPPTTGGSFHKCILLTHCQS